MRYYSALVLIVSVAFFSSPHAGESRRNLKGEVSGGTNSPHGSQPGNLPTRSAVGTRWCRASINPRH